MFFRELTINNKQTQKQTKNASRFIFVMVYDFKFSYTWPIVIVVIFFFNNSIDDHVPGVSLFFSCVCVCGN